MSAGGHFETGPINIYAISRIHEEASFNNVEKHSSQKRDMRHDTIFIVLQSIMIPDIFI